MAANIRCIMRAKAPYGQGITKMKVKLTPEQSSTPSLMPETNTVYLTRPTEGTGELMELVGGSVAWNQMATVYTGTRGGVTVADGGSGVVTLSGTTSATYFATHTVQAFTQNHVYFMHLVVDANPNSVPFSFLPYNLSGDFAINQNGGTKIAKWTSASKNSSIGVGSIATNVSVDGIKLRYTLVDLTQMLGSTIADYVYSLEQATPGSGIAWLKKYDLIDDQYHAYSAPTLQSVEATSHVTKDANNAVIATYPLDSDLVLRGIPKLSNGNLYYDGDTYEWDGTVTRKWGEVKLNGTDTEGWSLAATYGSVTRFDSTSIYHIAKNGGACFSNLFPEGAAGTQNKELVDIHGGDGHLIVQVSSSIASTIPAWKAYLAQHNLEVGYELATPTTESADPFTAVQTVEDGGTEEFVTTNGVPVGVVGRFANAAPMEGVDSFSVTADDGTTHTYPVSLSEEIYRGYVDMLTGEAVSDMASIAEYNGETINSPWLSSLDVYALGATPTRGAQVVYPITPEEVTATITGDPSSLSGVVSATSTEGTVEWSELSEIGIKCIMKRKNPFQ